MGMENEKKKNTMINYFKFFEGGPTKQRVFTDFMDAMDDHHLGGIPLPTNRTVVQDTGLMRPYTLKMYAGPSISTFLMAIEQSNLNDHEELRTTTIGQLTSGNLGIPWCFTSLTIRCIDNSLVAIYYHNVREIDRREIIFNPQDEVTIVYKP